MNWKEGEENLMIKLTPNKDKKDDMKKKVTQSCNNKFKHLMEKSCSNGHQTESNKFQNNQFASILIPYT